MSPQEHLTGNTPSPYKGLESYSESDGPLFFGRNEERDRLIYSLQSSRLTILYGARQIGKSSLLRAGVVNQLRQDAQRRAGPGRRPALATVVFDDWTGRDTMRTLSSAIDREFERLGVPTASSESGDFVDGCNRWTSALGADGGELFLVLDHFDQHLTLCPYYEDRPGSFDVEFSKLLSTRGLAVNVLIAIRDEMLAWLDRYRATVPGLYNNLFRLEPLTKRQAREAIQNPVYVTYNETHQDEKIGIEAELVRAALSSTALQCGSEGSAASASDERVDTGSLQLAMKAVWEREMSQGSRTLRNSTFDALGGLRGIAVNYVNERFGAFTPREQSLSARIFDHLLTPGGVGVAYQLSDLARRMGGDVTTSDLTALIGKLTDKRMVITSASGDALGVLCYETAHQVLTPAMLERVQDYHLERNKREKEILSDIEISLQLFFETSQVDGLNKILETSERWSEGARNLLVDPHLESNIRNALAKIEQNLTQSGQLAGYKGAVCTVAFSRNGKFIFTGTESGSVKVWDLRYPGRVNSSTEQTHKSWIWGLCASADNKWLASGSDDGTVALWAATNAGIQFCRRIPFAPDAAALPLVRGLAFSPDGSLLAIAATDGRVRLWHVYEERILCEFAASSCPVRCVDFAPDGRSLATGADDGLVGLWTLEGYPLIAEDQRSHFRHDSAVWDVRFHPRGERLASCGEDHRIKLWNVAGKHEEQTLIGHTCWVLDIDYSSDGTMLASASEDGTARIWDHAGNEIATLVHGAPVNSVSFSPDGLTLATAAADCRVRLWNLQQDPKRRSPKRFRHPGKAILLDVSFSSDGTSLATGGTDGEVQIWNQHEGRIARTLTGHGSWIMCVGFHPLVATSLATGSIDGTARVWNVSDGSSTLITPKDGPVWSIGFSADGRFLATGTGGGKACVWDLLDLQDTPATSFSSAHGSVWSVRFSPDGNWIAAGCQDGSIHIRDLTGRDVMQLGGVHAGPVLSFSFSPDGKYLASASSEGRICVWDIGRQAKASVRDLDAPIWRIVFNATGEILATGSVNRSVCLWNLALERLGMYSAEGPIRGLAFSRSGDWLAGSCSDGTVRLWPVGDDDFGSLLERAKSERNEILRFVWPQASAASA